MRDFKYLIRDIMPCWYELSWDGNKNQPAIIIRVHKDFIKKNGVIPADAPIIAHFQKELGLSDFYRNLNEGFGFEDAFKKVSENEEFVNLSAMVPKIKKEQTITCSLCKGSGKGHFEGEECLSCDGKGFEYEINWHDAFAVSASFTVFSMLTYYTEIETASKIPQLLLVQTITKQGMHGGSLSGMYSIPLVNWLSSFAGNIPEMVTAMMQAYGWMVGLRKFGEHRFRASVDYENGWLNVDCPGDACGLYPSNPSPSRSNDVRGYEFSCHNTDSPLQQITLLAGLAALHDKARKEINLQP